MAVRWLTTFWDLPADRFEEATAFWLGATGTALSVRRGPAGEFATLLPPDGDAHLRVQRIRTGKGGNHIDLHVDDVESDAEQAIDLGATALHVEPGFVVLCSPGGMAFCLVTHHGESRRPAPRHWPDGETSQANTFCIDIPPDRYESECGFWSALTGWPLTSSYGPEFLRLDHPPEIPTDIIFQQLAHPAPTEPVKAHLDLTATDIDAVTEHHRSLGATPIARFEHWQTLSDPAGLVYCIT